MTNFVMFVNEMATVAITNAFYQCNSQGRPV